MSGSSKDLFQFTERYSLQAKFCLSTTSMQQLWPAYSWTLQWQISNRVCIHCNGLHWSSSKKLNGQNEHFKNTHKWQWFACLMHFAAQCTAFKMRAFCHRHCTDLYFILLIQCSHQPEYTHTHAHAKYSYVGLLNESVDRQKAGGHTYHICFSLHTFDLG